jgi:LCCL domain
MKYFILMFTLIAAVSFAACKKGQPIACTDRMDRIPNLTNVSGATLKVHCPQNCFTGTVYGDGVYTVDSAVCVAAVHAGVLDAVKGGNVELRVVPSQPGYPGSEKNGISSRQWSSSWGNTAFTVK